MTTRTYKDYAIEHAGYLADAVKHFLSRLDAEFDASEALEAAEAADAEDAEQKADDLRSIEEEVGEARSVLRNRVYEFEKRRDRAAASGVKGEQTDWSKVPPDQWPSKCPKCGAGLSYTSYEPYCAYADCRWNNEPDGVAPSDGGQHG